jgi:hypothetical protein
MRAGLLRLSFAFFLVLSFFGTVLIYREIVSRHLAPAPHGVFPTLGGVSSFKKAKLEDAKGSGLDAGVPAGDSGDRSEGTIGGDAAGVLATTVAVSSCRHTQEHSRVVADDRGVLCARADVDWRTGCCTVATAVNPRLDKSLQNTSSESESESESSSVSSLSLCSDCDDGCQPPPLGTATPPLPAPSSASPSSAFRPCTCCCAAFPVCVSCCLLGVHAGVQRADDNSRIDNTSEPSKGANSPSQGTPQGTVVSKQYCKEAEDAFEMCKCLCRSGTFALLRRRLFARRSSVLVSSLPAAGVVVALGFLLVHVLALVLGLVLLVIVPVVVDDALCCCAPLGGRAVCPFARSRRVRSGPTAHPRCTRTRTSRRVISASPSVATSDGAEQCTLTQQTTRLPPPTTGDPRTSSASSRHHAQEQKGFSLKTKHNARRLPSCAFVLFLSFFVLVLLLVLLLLLLLRLLRAPLLLALLLRFHFCC